MRTFDIIFLSIVVIYAFFITVKIASLKKVNNEYQILQKHKPNSNDMIDLLNQKIPTVITGEVEEWFIFDRNDNIVEDKLNSTTLNENTKRLCYPLPIVKKYQINSYKKDFHSLITSEKNTRNFIVLLEGQLSVYLLNPSQNEEVKKNKNLLTNSNLKFMEVKLHAEQVLHIPYGWHYAWKCQDKCKILEVNSETLVTLPIKIILDSRN